MPHWYRGGGAESLANIEAAAAVLDVTAGAQGDAIVGGEFDVPFDFSTGTDFAPIGSDALFVDVSR